jgi:hypothetical protein
MREFIETPEPCCGDLDRFDSEIVNAIETTPSVVVCQGHCGAEHYRCSYNPKGTCSLTQGHARPHKCNICNQLYM